MRTLVVLLLMAACSGDDGATPGPDAGGPLDGTYATTWTCASGCAVTAPPLTGAVSLTIAGRVLAFSGGAGVTTHIATGESEHCLGVPAATEPNGRERDAYQICRTELTATTDIKWLTAQSPTPTVWHLRAVQ